MAFPPAVLPINRSNATVMTDLHPQDHNSVNQAVNDTVAFINVRHGVTGSSSAQTAAAGITHTINWGTRTSSPPGTNWSPDATKFVIAEAGYFVASLLVSFTVTPSPIILFAVLDGVQWPTATSSTNNNQMMTFTFGAGVGTQVWFQMYNGGAVISYSANAGITRVAS